ncbi:restriction endonuclease [Lysobacteraceae bacterium NML120232]|nr:restriction endonuclease [Xanthomonadaceae bacterium NML08-0793]PJK13221.1 restriction endonuclease [Xanthomonadaceae bacterium NML120232]
MPLSATEKQKILDAACTWFEETVATAHLKNTRKLVSPKEFKINPFLVVYLANFMAGNATPESIARALILPRALGTSINTTFGTQMQSFISAIQDAVGSTASGMDIEFTDQLDGRRKYCQVKAGPNTINKDDVETIANHFKAVRNLSRTNNLRIPNDDMIVGVLYGEPEALSAHYKRITSQYDYEVVIGQDFWHRLTGDEHFYHALISAIGGVANKVDCSKELEGVIQELAKHPTIQALAKSN